VSENGELPELPTGWEWAELASVAGVDGLFVDGDWILAEDLKSGRDVRLLQLGDVGVGRFLDKSAKWISAARFEQLDCTQVLPGDLLISRMAEPIARACQVPPLADRMITAVDVTICRVTNPGFDPEYVMHALNSSVMREQAEREARGTTRRRITRKRLGTLLLPKPPLEIQRRVVEALSTQDEQILEADRQLQASLADLERFERAILYRHMHRAEVAGGNLSKDWRLRAIADGIELVGVTKKIKKRDYLPSGVLPVVDQGEGQINGYTDDVTAAVAADPPLVVFGDHTRRLKYCPFPFAQGADGLKVLRPREGISPKFLYWALRAIDLPSRGYGRHFGLLRKEAIGVPPPARQEHIVAQLEACFAGIDLLRNMICEARAATGALSSAARRSLVLGVRERVLDANSQVAN
jgi:hypothetical protein